jgi:hypothetical protein
MVLAFLTFIMGLAISTVAIYYSVVGLAAIFAAAVVPIIIMGTTLEVSKLVAAWWLKWNWDRAPVLLKYYLLAAVVVLMLITSMGIFGFLSKAHIEQTAASGQSLAQVERIDTEIVRQNSVVNRAETRLTQLETSGTSVDANIQGQIDAEQARIDSAYNRVQPAIAEQQRIIDNQTKLFTDQIDAIDRQLALLQQYIDQNEVAKAQSMVGSRADGRWGPATAEAVRTWQAAQAEKRRELVATVERLNNNATVRAARDEIQRIRRNVEIQISESNALINRLRSQLGNTSTNDLETQISEERERLSTAFAEIERLSAEKFTLETEYRKLEAEVGPIKYIAEFVYGQEADQNLLERAVTWVIILIIFVFDPLAVLLLIASQVSFRWAMDERAAQAVDTDDSPPTEIPVEDPQIEATNESQPEELKVEDDQELSDEQLVDQELDKLAKELLIDFEDDDDDSNVPEHIKIAKKAWKIDHPTDSLKHQRRLLESGVINELPWLLPPYHLEAVDDDALQAARWAQEQIDKVNIEKVSWIENENGNQVKKEGYVQNQEQGEDTIWKKVKDSKDKE